MITDAELDRRVAEGGMGYRNADRYLRPLSPADRLTVVREANCRMALSPGWNFSGAVSQAVKDLGANPMTAQADQLVAYDPDGTKAAEAESQGVSWDVFKREAETAPRQDTTTEETDMKITEGPLTDRQEDVLGDVSIGHRYDRIAHSRGVSLSTVKHEVSNIVAKFGAETLPQAVARSSTARAYLEAAGLIEADVKINFHDDPAVSRVLLGLADILRRRAARLIPQ